MCFVDATKCNICIRNEEYTFTLHLRVLHQKDWTDLTYSRTRLQSLYQIARFIIERNALRPKVYSNTEPAIDPIPEIRAS